MVAEGSRGDERGLEVLLETTLVDRDDEERTVGRGLWYISGEGDDEAATEILTEETLGCVLG